MGRRADHQFTLPDGRLVGYDLTRPGRVRRVRFLDPDGKRVELSTGCRTEADAHVEAAKIVLKTYFPKPDSLPGRATWDTALAELAATPGLRPDSVRGYAVAVRAFRATVPGTRGPAEVTPELAHRFKRLYLTGRTKRGKASDARTYARSPATCRTYLRSLRSLWNTHFRELGYVRDNPWAGVPYPEVERKAVKAPAEDRVAEFFAWLGARYPGWPLVRLFCEVKALAGCRTLDLCLVRSEQVAGGRLTFTAAQTKHRKERAVALPPDLFAALRALAGPTYLWERYTADARVHRPGPRNKPEFAPKTLYWAVTNIFREFNRARPGTRLKPHDLRKRAITLTAMASQNVDATAQAIGIDPQTARRYYLDAQAAFNADDLMRRMAGLLRPPTASGPATGQGDRT